MPARRGAGTKTPPRVCGGGVLEFVRGPANPRTVGRRAGSERVVHLLAPTPPDRSDSGRGDCRSGRRRRQAWRTVRRDRSRPCGSFRVPQSPQRRRQVAPIRRSHGLEVVDADLLRGMKIPARLGENRRHVAGRAVGLAVERASPLSAAAPSKVPPVAGGWQRQLIEVERRQLGGDPVFLVLLVSLPGSCSDRVLLGIIEPRIVEHALAVHFEVGDIGVPVGDRSPRTRSRYDCSRRPDRRPGGFRVAAVLPSGRKALPSRFSSASNLPGPQASKARLTSASGI